MRQLKSHLFLSACALALFMPTPSHAALIDGSILNFNGNATVGATFLTWLCNQPGDVSGCSAGYGDFATNLNTGSFAQYNGTFGEIKSIDNTTAPLNKPNLGVTNFIKFDANNNITLELSFIPLGTKTVSATCAGLTSCTPQNAALITAFNPGGLSAFNLDQNATGTSAAFGVNGIVHEGANTANFAGIFTAQFVGLNPQQVLASVVAGNPTPYSAQFNLTLVPEPATYAMVGAGLLLIGLVGRSRRAARS